MNKSYNAWTPRLLPLNSPRVQFVAPYWADTDLTGTGQVYYRQTNDPVLLARATNEIQRVFTLYQSLDVTNLFIATWDAVGYYHRQANKVLLCNSLCLYVCMYGHNYVCMYVCIYICICTVKI